MEHPGASCSRVACARAKGPCWPLTVNGLVVVRAGLEGKQIGYVMGNGSWYNLVTAVGVKILRDWDCRLQLCWSNGGIRPRGVCGSSHGQGKGLGEGKSPGEKSGCVLLMFALHDLTKRAVRALTKGKDPLLAFSSSGWFLPIIWFSWEKRGRCFDFLQEVFILCLPVFRHPVS